MESSSSSSSAYLFVKTEWRKLLLLLSMCLVYFFSFFQRVAVPGTCFDELQREFTASAAAITALGSIFLYVYGGSQLFVGMLADRFGGRRSLLAGATLLACTSLLFPFARSLTELYIIRALLAVGASTIYLSMAKEIDTLFHPRQFTIWLGVALFMGYSGGLVGTAPFERALSHFGWRNAMLGAGAICTLALIATALVFRKFRGSRPERSKPSAGCLGSVLLNPLTYPPAITGSINFSIYFLFQGAIGKKLLSDCCGVSSARAASITFLMMLLCMIGVFACGFISRMIGNRRKPIILACVLMMLASTTTLAITMHDRPDFRIVAAGLLVIAIAVSPSPVSASSVKEVNACNAAGTSMGMSNFMAYIVVAVVTSIAGMAMDCFKDQACQTTQGIIYPIAAYRLIFAGCAVLSAVSVIFACFIRETKGAYITCACPPGGK